jgi:hypothetical protein
MSDSLFVPDFGILFSHRISYCQIFGLARYVGVSLDKIQR